MFFWVKKLLGYWIMPVPVCLVLLVTGVLLLRRRDRERTGRLLVTLATVLLLVLSNKLISAWLVRPLEFRYPAVPELHAGQPLPPGLADCRYVVVLGGGNGNTPGVAALNELSTSARARITEGVRILRLLPAAHLIVSGPGNGYGETHATMLERAAISLGIGPERIERIELARDTEDESAAVKRLAGDAPVALVTSAWHMPRSMALFRSAGVRATPCPTDYTAHSDGAFHWRDLLFDVESIERSSFAIRERAGYLWITLRGRNGA